MLPPSRYRLDRLLLPDSDPKTGNGRRGFESLDSVLAEDSRRASGLRLVASGLYQKGGWGPASPDFTELRHLKFDRRAATNLADRLEEGAQSRMPAATMASALYMRDQRLRVIGAVLAMVDQCPITPLSVFTAIHRSWCYPAGELADIDLPKLTNQFRTHLYRGGVISASGYLAAFVHGEFEPNSESYQLHFHGVAAGEKALALNNLRGKQGYIRTVEINRPIWVSPLNEKARQLSYLMQFFWPKKFRAPQSDGTYKRTRTKTRIAEPYHSLYLLWLDQWSISDMWLLSGISMKGGRMVAV